MAHLSLLGHPVQACWFQPVLEGGDLPPHLKTSEQQSPHRPNRDNTNELVICHVIQNNGMAENVIFVRGI